MKKAGCALALVSLGLIGCDKRPSEPESKKQGGSQEQAPSPSVETKPKKSAPVGDPLEGKFSLADATKGLPEQGKLVATIVTSSGTLQCELFEDKAPITVANFVGLARGLRPFQMPNGAWAEKPGYDGTKFHRIIRGFMIQGGDPAGTGAGGPGYVIPDEIWPGSRHDERGLLCMANRGPNTNGMQFFILDAPAPHLDGGYTIFGKCGPDAVIEKLAASPVQGDRALDPPVIDKVTVDRTEAAPPG